MSSDDIVYNAIKSEMDSMGAIVTWNQLAGHPRQPDNWFEDGISMLSRELDYKRRSAKEPTYTKVPFHAFCGIIWGRLHIMGLSLSMECIIGNVDLRLKEMCVYS